MRLPLSTGQTAQFLGVTEPRLNDLVRKGRLDPTPDSVAGRRQWWPEHILAAAAAIGVLTTALRSQIETLPRGAPREA